MSEFRNTFTFINLEDALNRSSSWSRGIKARAAVALCQNSSTLLHGISKGTWGHSKNQPIRPASTSSQGGTALPDYRDHSFI